eukprot:SAG11_NODE_106_length_16423_cov_51.220840_19_plen_40_part_00
MQRLTLRLGSAEAEGSLTAALKASGWVEALCAGVVSLPL